MGVPVLLVASICMGLAFKHRAPKVVPKVIDEDDIEEGLDALRPEDREKERRRRLLQRQLRNINEAEIEARAVQRIAAIQKMNQGKNGSVHMHVTTTGRGLGDVLKNIGRRISRSLSAARRPSHSLEGGGVGGGDGILRRLSKSLRRLSSRVSFGDPGNDPLNKWLAASGAVPMAAAAAADAGAVGVPMVGGEASSPGVSRLAPPNSGRKVRISIDEVRSLSRA